MKRRERDQTEREKRKRKKGAQNRKEQERTGSVIRSIPKRRSIGKTEARIKEIAEKY